MEAPQIDQSGYQTRNELRIYRNGLNVVITKAL